jgi:hypothetical protein
MLDSRPEGAYVVPILLKVNGENRKFVRIERVMASGEIAQLELTPEEALSIASAIVALEHSYAV